MQLKTIVAKPGSPIKVTTFGKTYEVENPLALFFTSIAGCASYYIAKVADDLDLDKVEVHMSGVMQAQMLCSIDLVVHMGQQHDHEKRIYGAIENCAVIQHLCEDILLSVEVV